jgi:DNA-binding NtrC family response regulator
MARILVIDDDQQLGKLLVRILTQDHHQVIIADHWKDSLLSSPQDRFDLIVTGKLKKCEDGLAIIDTLAKAGASVPVIAMPGGFGLMSDRVSVESASMLGIKITPVRTFVSADLRQSVAEALA